jgi:hypothetical protein
VTHHEEFNDAIAFAKKYSRDLYSLVLYQTSEDSVLLSVKNKSGVCVDGAILYYNNNKWAVLNNHPSYMAVSSYEDYLEYCNMSYLRDSENELGGIEL